MRATATIGVVLLLAAPVSAQDAAAARELYARACDGGELTGCTGLGGLYERGAGVTRDAQRAAVLYRRACTGGELHACVALGRMYEGARAPPVSGSAAEAQARSGSAAEAQARDAVRAVALPDPPREAPAHRDALPAAATRPVVDTGPDAIADDARCDRDDERGCFDLGWRVEHGESGPPDVVRAGDLYRHACRAGDLRGCVGVGVLAERGTRPDYATARAYFQRACDGGEQRGCVDLAWLWEHGLGVATSLPAARALYSSACDAGEATGCADLAAVDARDGRGDRRALLALEETACGDGSGVACGVLAFHYADGGRDGDLGRALTAYQRACDLGESPACVNLGVMQERGLGAAASPTHALELYERACRAGNAVGCANADLAYTNAVHERRGEAAAPGQ